MQERGLFRRLEGRDATKSADVSMSRGPNVLRCSTRSPTARIRVWGGDGAKLRGPVGGRLGAFLGPSSFSLDPPVPSNRALGL